MLKYKSGSLLKILLSVTAFVYIIQSVAQNTECIVAEDSISCWLKFVSNGKTDNEKYYYNEKIRNTFARILINEDSFNYPFDSLKSVARIMSSDKQFRIINWNLPREDGTHEYFGYIQVATEGMRKYSFTELTDKSEDIEAPTTMILSPEQWYGALYYKIIHTEYRNKDYYTLLGWDGNNFQTTKKIIDVITIRPNGKVQFGAAIFRKYNDKQRPVRIIFEYSSQAMMTLKYEKQYLHSIKKSKNRKRKKEKTLYQPMIVFDHLVPLDQRTTSYMVDLSDMYQFYVPETNVVDGFACQDGRWYYTPDVDARNPKPDKKKKNDNNMTANQEDDKKEKKKRRSILQRR